MEYSSHIGIYMLESIVGLTDNDTLLNTHILVITISCIDTQPTSVILLLSGLSESAFSFQLFRLVKQFTSKYPYLDVFCNLKPFLRIKSATSYYLTLFACIFLT